jgi:hypothetical protein
MIMVRHSAEDAFGVISYLVSVTFPPGGLIPPVNRVICPPKGGSAAQCLIDTASLGVALCLAPHPSEGSRGYVPQVVLRPGDAERVSHREQTLGSAALNERCVHLSGTQKRAAPGGKPSGGHRDPSGATS